MAQQVSVQLLILAQVMISRSFDLTLGSTPKGAYLKNKTKQQKAKQNLNITTITTQQKSLFYIKEKTRSLLRILKKMHFFPSCY